MTYIFKHYIKTEHIFMHIDEQFLDAEENAHVKKVVEDTMHHKLLDMVLDELDAEKRVHFLAGIEDEKNHEKLLSDLQVWIDDFEAKIAKHIKEAEKDILKLVEG